MRGDWNRELRRGGGGLLPAYSTGKQAGDTHYMGTELHGPMTWRFTPGLSRDNGVGYVFAGQGMDALTLRTGRGPPRTSSS